MKKLVQRIIQLRNPKFQFSDQVKLNWVLQLSVLKLIALIRGLGYSIRKPVFIEKGVSMFAKNNIRLGKMVNIGSYTHLSGLGTDGLTINDNSSIGAFSRVIVSTTFDNPGSYIKIGSGVGIGEFAYLGGAGGLEIGDDCIIGQYFSCHPENHNFQDSTKLIKHQGTTRKGISIGKNCWIGAKVTICDGVQIGENSVIAAGAVVTKSMPANCVIGGVPAKIIKYTTPEYKIAV